MSKLKSKKSEETTVYQDLELLEQILKPEVVKPKPICFKGNHIKILHQMDKKGISAADIIANVPSPKSIKDYEDFIEANI